MTENLHKKIGYWASSRAGINLSYQISAILKMNRPNSRLFTQFRVIHRSLTSSHEPCNNSKAKCMSFMAVPECRNQQFPIHNIFRSYSTKNGNNRPQSKELGESSLLVQEGTEFQEVPVAVLRSDPCKNESKVPPKPYVDLDPREEAAFVEGFKNFHSPQEVLGILDLIPSQEVTPIVALSILRKLFELENNFGFRNDGRSWVVASPENSSVETFARMAIVARLVDIVILGEESSVLLDALDILRVERKLLQNSQFDDDYREEFEHSDIRIQEFSNYRSKLCDEILIRTSKGKLSLEQVSRAICSMGEMEKQFPSEVQPDFLDKMWIGISDKNHKIELNTLPLIFKTLQYFKKSRRLVMNLVERKCLSLWWRMEPDMVAEICGLLLKDAGTSRKQHWGSVSTRLLMSLSRAFSLNLHKVTEVEMLQVLRAFNTLNFCDAAMEKALSKYMKAKSRKITDSTLISVTMDYVKKFRLRSSLILDGVAEWVVLQHEANLSGPNLVSILEPFGLLDYQPPNGLKFWDILERALQAKFIQLPPKDVIELLLSCVYLKKYPLNFVDRVFSPYFLDRLHTSETDLNVLQQTRSRLKLLDTALTLECGSRYNGPYLPRDFTAKTVYIDGRILRMANSLQQPLSTIFKKSKYTIETRVVLPNLPLNPLYIVDLVVSRVSKQIPDRQSEPEDLNNLELEHMHSKEILRNQINLRNEHRRHYVPIPPGAGYDILAILINIPEHYSYDGKTLLGPQVMRLRHLKLLGCKVVNLSYEHLAELLVTPNGLVEYLETSLNKIGEPIS